MQPELTLSLAGALLVDLEPMLGLELLDLEFSLTELKLVEKALRTGNWSAVLPWIETTAWFKPARTARAATFGREKSRPFVMTPIVR